MISVKPFIKWAGGKSQLLDDIRAKYPNKIERYCEPFVGGGAVLLDVLANFKPREVLINDINTELINTYIQVRDNLEDVVTLLSKYQSLYHPMESEARKEFYYVKRARFNELKSAKSPDLTEQAALFIFLNKTCFNGLYRVNSKGQFNVPIGSYKMPPICDEANLKRISGLLSGVEVRCGNYQSCADYIDENTFVYIDPPYRPLTTTSSFTSYSENEFGDKQQIELCRFIDEISEKGAKVVASNSDPKNSDGSDCFFDELYKRYLIERVSAKRTINSNADSRGNISELLICNF